MFGREPASAATPGFPTYMPTYVPTYFPTSAAMAEDATEDVSLGDIISGIFGNVTSSVVEEEEETVAISTAVEEATESVTDEVSMEDLIAGVLGNITSSVVEEEEEQEEETVTNSTAAAVSTTTPEATTTIPPHPVCGNATDSRVFQIQWTPEDENATYAFTDIDETTVYSEAVERQHTVGVQYEEKVCVLPGEYQFSMSDGACVNGYFRDELILFSCAEGSIVVIIEERVVGDNPEW